MGALEAPTSADLALPGEVTETSLTLDAGLPFERWAEVGDHLGRIGRAHKWWIGDWLNYGEQEYGEKYSQAMEATGLDYSTVSDYAWVAKAVETSVRTESLSWSHHKQVAALEPARQAEWLRRARDERLSANDLRRRIGLSVHFSSETDEWATPQDLFDELHAEFAFQVDVCASLDNAKCQRYFGGQIDGLAQEWTGTCWMNPPYGDVIGQWVKKAYDSALDGATVVCLLPARVDTGWWWDYCRHAEIRFLRGRLKFGGGENSAPFPSAVVVFGRPPCVKWWER